MESLSYIVAAQIRPENTVRALVIGIGKRPWVFSKARAEIRCRTAHPNLTADDLESLVHRIAVEADAVVAPILGILGSSAPKCRVTAAQAKRRLLRKPGMYRLGEIA